MGALSRPGIQMSLTPQDKQTVAVLGAGSIGTAWAILFASAGFPVRLQEPNPERLAAARGEIAARLGDLQAHGLGEEPIEWVLARIAFVAEIAEALSSATHVQECAPEDVELKRRLFAELDRMAEPAAILASSSSFLPASSFAEGLAGRARCLVAHPGNPPYLLRVVELVPAPFTAPDVMARPAAFFRAAGTTPIALGREIDGFVFNRLQGALLREAYCLLRDGIATTEEIDRIVRDGLGLRWSVIGPFETADLNTRGGIAEHARRMGPAYRRMGAERGQDDPWTAELVARATAERRDALPLAGWGERVAWRDRALMALLKFRRDALRRDNRDRPS
jgi:L-gulonate 3-dehydrogenase